MQPLHSRSNLLSRSGLPLANELWREVMHRAWPMAGCAEKFPHDLKAFIEFKRRPTVTSTDGRLLAVFFLP